MIAIPSKQSHEQYGAVLTFHQDLTPEEIGKALLKIDEVLDGLIIRPFNPEWGQPVFYVP